MTADFKEGADDCLSRGSAGMLNTSGNLVDNLMIGAPWGHRHSGRTGHQVLLCFRFWYSNCHGSGAGGPVLGKS